MSLGGGGQAGERYCPDPGDHSPYRDVSSEQCGQQAGGQQQEPGHFMGIEAGDGQVECGDGAGRQCG